MTESTPTTPSRAPMPQPAASQPPMSRRAALAIGSTLAAGVATVAAAAPAAGASLPADSGSSHAVLDLGLAQNIVEAAAREARRIGVPSFIVVVDDCGDVKASVRQDGNSRASLTLAPLKAQTALAFRTPTATLAQRTTDPIRAQSFLAAGFTLLGGGLPISIGGQVVGAIGTGGGSPEQDIQVAQAGLAALRS